MEPVVKQNEIMTPHTTLKIGGPADFYIAPASIDELIQSVRFAAQKCIPYTVIGGGSNVLISDRGIRGLVINLSRFSRLSRMGNLVIAGAGSAISDLCTWTAAKELMGLEFLSAMPGSVGGAVWMNARCYGHSIDEKLVWTDYLDSSLQKKRLQRKNSEFAYKVSPFQQTGHIILSAAFRLAPGCRTEILAAMEQFRRDRVAKGHFLYPSAGSIFKNNYDIGEPTGKLIDSLGLRGMRRGDAQIADFHGNIIVNRGNAKAEDVLYLMEYMETMVLKELGFRLDREIRLLGDWDG